MQRWAARATSASDFLKMGEFGAADRISTVTNARLQCVPFRPRVKQELEKRRQLEEAARREVESKACTFKPKVHANLREPCRRTLALKTAVLNFLPDHSRTFPSPDEYEVQRAEWGHLSHSGALQRAGAYSACQLGN